MTEECFGLSTIHVNLSAPLVTAIVSVAMDFRDMELSAQVGFLVLGSQTGVSGVGEE